MTTPDSSQHSDIDGFRFRIPESVLHAIDRQIVTSGIRLILVLPTFSLVTFFFAWAFSKTSPDWWVKNIQPTLGIEFSLALALMTFIVLLGFILAIGFHRYRVSLSLHSFYQKVEASNKEHRSIQSLHGYDGLHFQLLNSMQHHNRTLILAILSAMCLIISIYFGVQESPGLYSLLMSASLLILSFGQHLPTRSFPFNTVDTTGLLSAYQPPVHPSTLKMVFNDLITTYMDPLLRAQFDEFTKEMEKEFQPGIDYHFAHEKFLMTLYRHASGLDRKTVSSELSEIFTEAGLHFVLNHPVFTLEVWLTLMGKIGASCPAFFRMVDRLKQDLEAGRPPAMEDLVFEVDMENVVSTRANLFTIFHNLSEETRTVVFRVQTPNFEPKDMALTYRLEPGEVYWWSNESLPLAAEGDEDVLGKISGLLRDSTVAWQTLIPLSKGEATVSVRLEETNGELLIGRQINVRVRSNFRQWMRQTGAIVSHLIGGLGLLISTGFLFLSLVNSMS